MGPLRHRASSLAAAGGFATLAALAGLPYLQPFEVAASAALAGIMGAIAAEDFRRYRVPDALNLAAALAGFVTLWLEARAAQLDVWPAMLQALLQMALCGGALWLVREAFFRLRGVDGLGLGDVKLAAAAGIWLAPDLFAAAVLLASVGALAFVGARRALDGSWPPDRRIPFAFYLAPAIWLCWFLSRLFLFPLVS